MNVEQWNVLRRIAERGLKMAQDGKFAFSDGYADASGEHLDLWQHLLDELERCKP